MRSSSHLPSVAVTALAGLALAAGSVAFDFPPEWDRQAAKENGWIYDDLEAAMDQAKETGKPILAVLRCPP